MYTNREYICTGEIHATHNGQATENYILGDETCKQMEIVKQCNKENYFFVSIETNFVMGFFKEGGIQ